MPVKKVSEKSTKTELWDAYNSLVEKAEGQSVLPLGEGKSKVPEALRSLADLKIKIGTDLDKISGEVAAEVDNFSEIQTKIAKDKRSMLDLFDLQKKTLEDEIKKVKISWEDEQREIARTIELSTGEEFKKRKREEEEYKYNLSLARRKEVDEYATRKFEREKNLAEKEKTLKDRLDEITTMEKQVGEMPEKIVSATLDAQTSTTKELTDKYTTEIKELKMLHDHEQKMAELKGTNLESLVKSQSIEIESLKRQIENSTKQVKDIAVSVIEGRAAANKPATNQPQENPNK